MRSAGYAATDYLAALGQVALPLGKTGGHLCIRPIAETGLVDLAGPYPLFTCSDWSAMTSALAELPSGPVTLTLVTDPACPLTEAELHRLFTVCRKLHDHWLIDLARPFTPSRHHRKKLRAESAIRLEVGPAVPGDGIAFAALYAHLVARKHITDLRAFAPGTVSALAELPGAHLVRAFLGNTLVGADLYYLTNERAYAHLSAYAAEGYALSVSYPMMAAAVDYFAPLTGIIDLGGAPGGIAGKGIAHFKSGWTDLTLPSFLCGNILDATAYAQLAPGADLAGWFPAYRHGEFTNGQDRPKGP